MKDTKLPRVAMLASQSHKQDGFASNSKSSQDVKNWDTSTRPSNNSKTRTNDLRKSIDLKASDVRKSREDLRASADFSTAFRKASGTRPGDNHRKVMSASCDNFKPSMFLGQAKSRSVMLNSVPSIPEGTSYRKPKTGIPVPPLQPSYSCNSQASMSPEPSPVLSNNTSTYSNIDLAERAVTPISKPELKSLLELTAEKLDRQTQMQEERHALQQQLVQKDADIEIERQRYNDLQRQLNKLSEEKAAMQAQMHEMRSAWSVNESRGRAAAESSEVCKQALSNNMLLSINSFGHLTESYQINAQLQAQLEDKERLLGLAQERNRQLETDLQEVQDTLSRAQAEKSELSQKTKEFRKDVKSMEARMSLMEQKYQEVESRLRDTKHQLAAKATELQQANTQLSRTTTDASSSEKRLLELETEVERLMQEREFLHSQVEEKDSLKEMLTAALQEGEQQVSLAKRLQKDLSTCKAQLQQVEEAAAKHKQQADSLSSQLETEIVAGADVRMQLDQAQQALQDEQQQNAQLISKNAELEEDVLQLKQLLSKEQDARQQLQNKSTKHQSDLSQLASNNSDQQLKITHLSQVVTDQRSQITKLTHQLSDAMSAMQADADMELSDMHEKLGEAEKQLLSFAHEKDAWMAEAASLRREVAMFKAQVDNMRMNESSLLSKIASGEGERMKLARQLDHARKEADDVSRQLEKGMSEVESLTARLHASQATVAMRADATADREQLLAEVTALKLELQASRKQTAQLQESLDEQRQTSERREVQLRTLRQQVGEGEERAAQLETERDLLRHQVSENQRLRTRVHDLTQQLTETEAALEHERAVHAAALIAEASAHSSAPSTASSTPRAMPAIPEAEPVLMDTASGAAQALDVSNRDVGHVERKRGRRGPLRTIMHSTVKAVAWAGVTAAVVVASHSGIISPVVKQPRSRLGGRLDNNSTSGHTAVPLSLAATLDASASNAVLSEVVQPAHAEPSVTHAQLTDVGASN